MLISFRFCRILSSSPWLELLKPLFFSLSVRTQGRSSARFWLRPRWSWTNWWRRSARLWTSQSLTGRPAGWPDRSVNSAWREGWWNHSEQFRCQAEALVHSVLWNWELTKSKSYSVLLGYVLLPQILCLCIVSAGKILAWWATSSKSLTQRQTKKIKKENRTELAELAVRTEQPECFSITEYFSHKMHHTTLCPCKFFFHGTAQQTPCSTGNTALLWALITWKIIITAR